MSASPYEIIAGPANLWIAASGTAFPAIEAAPGGSWISLGNTHGGVNVELVTENNQLMVDQVLAPVKVIRTRIGATVKCDLAEITLERFAKVWNQATVVDTAPGGGAGHRAVALDADPDFTVFSLLVRGPSPYLDANLQFELPRIVSVANPALKFTREDRAVLGVEFIAIYDAAAATAGTFGILRAQDQ